LGYLSSFICEQSTGTATIKAPFGKKMVQVKDNPELFKTMTRPKNVTSCYRVVSRSTSLGTDKNCRLRLSHVIGPVASVGTLTRCRRNLRIGYLDIEVHVTRAA